ncbi:3D domain-containing protein [Flavobacteriaceae bacterium LMO-SS05]
MIVRVTLIIVMVLMLGCEEEPKPKYEWKSLRVTSTAYNSTNRQTDGDPFIGAFGDSLKSSIKSIAVSEDLYRLGLKPNTFVIIEGLKGVYLVRDRMHDRWNNKIDIYMGTDIISAKRWGRKKVNIYYRVKLNEHQNLN